MRGMRLLGRLLGSKVTSMRWRSVVITLMVIAVPAIPFAFAKSADAVKREIAAFKVRLQLDADETKWEKEEGERLTGVDPFPPIEGEGEDERVTESVDTTSAFVIVRENGIPTELKDVPRQAWFAPYVRHMADMSVVGGYRDATGRLSGIFKPEGNVTVEELAKMSVQASGTDRSSCPASPKNAAAKDGWSSPFIACAEAWGWSLFADGTVDIHRPATRAEVVQTVLQAFVVDINAMAGATPPFKDVSGADAFGPAITFAAQGGIIDSGADDRGKITGNFRPGEPVNRAEVCKIMSKAVQVYAH